MLVPIFAMDKLNEHTQIIVIAPHNYSAEQCLSLLIWKLHISTLAIFSGSFRENLPSLLYEQFYEPFLSVHFQFRMNKSILFDTEAAKYALW